MNVDEELRIFEAELYKLSPSAQAAAKKFLSEVDKMKNAASKKVSYYSTSIEDLSHEIWRDVVGYEGLYHVSNLGRIKSFHNNKVIIREPALSNGYLKVSLCKDGSIRTHKIHTLVAKTFIPNPAGKPFVNHIDGNKTNNCVENLEWVTGKENMQHASKMGLIHFRGLKGSANPSAKFSDDVIREIRSICILGDPEFGAKALAEIYGSHPITIRRIVHGEAYTDVDDGQLDIKYARKRLSAEDKQWIREHYIKGDPKFGIYALAKRFDVDKTTIREAVERPEITGDENGSKRQGLSAEDKQWIREHYIKGDPEFGQRPLARKFGVDKTTIRAIVEN